MSPPADMAVAPAPDLAAVASLTVMTDKGAVTGMTDNGARAFLGIPFAAPPTGALRWKPPQPAAAWTGARDATQFGPKCTQYDLTGNFDAASSEDCLYLNVWTPPAATAKLPVMVFIHGGGFVSGSGEETVYDGAHLATTKNVVVVTLNYRLGPLGFLGHAGLAAEDPAHAWAGNYGLEDQRAALAWVQTNAAAFGGDATDVTIFGESAGGFSVCFQMLSPASKGLFARALVESGSCALPMPTAADGAAQGKRLATALGCSGDDATVLACLRGKSAKDVTTALPLKPEIILGQGESWTPLVDGHDVPDQPLALLGAGKLAPVPLLLGTNHDEGAIFFLFGGKVASDAAYKASLEGTFGATLGDQVYAEYPSSTYPSAEKALEDVVTDSWFVCPARRLARAAARAGQPTFRYEFERAPLTVVGNLGATHSMELPFVFGNSYLGFDPTANPDDASVADLMQTSWTTFAKAGSSADAGTFAWPKYDTTSEPYVKLDAPPQAATKLRDARCNFWDGLGS